MNRTRWALVGVMAFGLGFRLLYSWLAHFSNFDTGTVGYMAVNILEGDRPLFFYGQNYMGALEAYVGAVFVGLFGANEFAVGLSTILFATGWTGAMYLLFAEIHRPLSGLAAAAVAAVPGYWSVKYTVEPYGGYTVAFCFGTLALWLAVRIDRRDLGGRALWGHALGLGACAGIGLWTHYIVGPYLAVAGLFCARHLLRHWRRPGVYAGYACGAALAVLGLVPAVLMHEVNTGSHTVGFVLTGEHMAAATDNFFGGSLKKLLFWDIAASLGKTVENIWRVVLGIALAAGLAGYLAWLARERASRWAGWVPLLFMLVFFAVFLPHQLALEKAPRYAIPFAGFLLAAAFALGWDGFRKPWWRWVVGAGLGLFLLSQLAGQIVFVRGKIETKRGAVALHHKQVKEARKTGVEHIVMMGGDPKFMHHGQVLSFYSEGDPRFVALYDERVQAHAQAAETGSAGWTCVAQHAMRMWNSFGELRYPFQDNDSAGTKHALMFWPDPAGDFSLPVLRQVAPTSMVMHVNTVAVDRVEMFDRDIRTTLDGLWQIDIRFAAPTRPHVLWLICPDPLPRGLPSAYDIRVSADGRNWARVADCPTRIADSYRIGARCYFKGYQPRQGIVLGDAPEPAVFLRIRQNRNDTKKVPWKLNEIWVFERGGGFRDAESGSLARALELARGGELEFVYADRQASARIIDGAGEGHAFPRYNPKYTATLLPRTVLPRDGHAVLVDAALADECVSLLREAHGDCVERIESSPADPYALLRLRGGAATDATPSLVWNGHTILKATNPGSLTWH